MIRFLHLKYLLFWFVYLLASASICNAYQFELVTPIDKAVHSLLNANDHAYVTQKNFLLYKKTVAELYSLSPQSLLWLDQENLEAEKITAVLKLISTAKENGLNEAHYNLNLLQIKWQLLISLEQDNTLDDLALFDTAISINLLHFLSDIQFGRINPRTLNYNFEPKEKAAFDFVPLILNAIENNDISSLLDKVEPDLPAYRQLKKALLTYRSLNTIPRYSRLKYISSIQPNDTAPQIIAIRQQLNSLETLINKNNSASCLFDQELVNKIKNFQLLHGLENDGVIGKKTIQALNIPLSKRIQQIEMALERLRWLPKRQTGSRVMVNIPAFQLRAYNGNENNEPEVLNMKVIVGKSVERKSPIFTADMRYLEFSPYWNIPKSIILEEIIPKILKNPEYIEQQNMELVTGFHNNETPVPYTEDAVMQLKTGVLKMRQRPGRSNALGKVKFIFPNNYNVYLHDTASRRLFNQPKRDLSHGCIRVEKPFELANFLLQSKSGWNQKQTSLAMKRRQPKHVSLAQSIPVIIYYSTAEVVQDKIYFYNDIYGYDTKLAQALIKHNKAQNIF